MAGLENPRTVPDTVIAAAWQSAEGTAASTADAQVFFVDSFAGERGTVRIHPMGTSGSQWAKATEKEVATMPKASLRVLMNAHQAGLWLESLMCGPATVVDADITESAGGVGSGDAENICSNWAFSGVRPGFNVTDGMVAYAQILNEDPTAADVKVQIYSDSGLSQVVAEGTVTKASIPTTMTLTEQNNSGLSGTVQIDSDPTTDNAMALTMAKRTFSWSLQPSNFFTLWRDTGFEAERFVDCVVSSIKLSGADQGVLVAEIEVMAKTYSVEAAALTPATETVDFLCFADGVFRTDANGSPVTEYPKSFELTMSRRYTQHLGASSSPQKLIAEGMEPVSGSFVFRPTDGDDTLFDRGVADTWEDGVDLTFTRGDEVLTIVLDKLKWTDPKMPDVGVDQLGDRAMPFVAVERLDASVEPVVITLET